MGVTRKELRQTVGDKTGEMFVLRATGDSVDTSTFRDEIRLGDRGTNAPSLMNRIGFFSGSINDAIKGHECRTTGFDPETMTLSFRPAAPIAPVTGDELEIWSVADRAGSIDAIHRAINQAIRSVEDIVGREVYGDPVTFNMRSPYIDLPSTWSELGGVEWADRSGYLTDIRSQDAVVRPGRRTVELTGLGSMWANTQTVTPWGYLRSLPLAADGDVTDVDSEWLVESVISSMSLAQSWKASDRAAEERRASFWALRAAEYRTKVGFARRGWGVRLAPS